MKNQKSETTGPRNPVFLGKARRTTRPDIIKAMVQDATKSAKDDCENLMEKLNMWKRRMYEEIDKDNMHPHLALIYEQWYDETYGVVGRLYEAISKYYKIEKAIKSFSKPKVYRKRDTPDSLVTMR